MSLITVVVCTHNRAGLLARTIASLNGARRPAEGAEILVVANCCSDDTHKMLETAAQATSDSLPLQWLTEPAKGKSHALNLALRELRTPLVAFVDDDQRVDPGYLEAICQTAHSAPDAALFCGQLLPDWDNSEPAWVHDQGPYRIYPLPVPHFNLGPQPQWLTAETELPSGGNIVVRRAWIERIGPFSTELGPVGHDLGGAEDSEWFLRALRLGAKLLYSPNIVQRHHIEPERLRLQYLLRMAYQRTASNVSMQSAATSGGGVPLWAFRKLVRYAFLALTSLGSARRRFFMMRCAAALGEIEGCRRAVKGQFVAR